MENWFYSALIWLAYCNHYRKLCSYLTGFLFLFWLQRKYFIFQNMQSQSIIIIHPGSQNLRIGKASDLSPHLILHAVARRRLPGGIPHEDYLLPPSVSVVIAFKFAFLNFFNSRKSIQHCNSSQIKW